MMVKSDLNSNTRSWINSANEAIEHNQVIIALADN